MLASVATVRAAERGLRDADPYDGLAASLADAPADAVVEVAIADPWAQAWIAYDLRDRRVSIAQPSIHLNGMGSTWVGSTELPEPSYRVELANDDAVGLWKGPGLVLVATSAE